MGTQSRETGYLISLRLQTLETSITTPRFLRYLAQFI